LLAYHWPGNVRELANVIERAVVLGAMPVANSSEVVLTIDPVKSDQTVSYRDAVNAARKDIIQRVLTKTHGNRAAAARLLQLETKYFLKLIKSLGIE
jgi:DNA-binding NtrC family response regulator